MWDKNDHPTCPAGSLWDWDTEKTAHNTPLGGRLCLLPTFSRPLATVYSAYPTTLYLVCLTTCANTQWVVPLTLNTCLKEQLIMGHLQHLQVSKGHHPHAHTQEPSQVTNVDNLKNAPIRKLHLTFKTLLIRKVSYWWQMATEYYEEQRTYGKNKIQ